MEQSLPIVAVVGQPNAGKSTLINKIVKRPLAITSDVAGTTRDRQYVDTAWNGSVFTLVDTAGLSMEKDELHLSLSKQIEIALKEADAVIFVVDGKQPSAAVESQTIKKFRNLKTPLALAINKMDSPRADIEKIKDFKKLGIKDMFSISAISGRGIGDLLDFAAEAVKDKQPPEHSEEQPSIAVSIVGKPNVGKSSIFNAILKEERVVVSPIAGTTRTAIDSRIEIGGTDYTFIDTAGLKKKEHRQAQPDIFAGFQSFKAIRRSDICFLVLDATEEITKQDQRVASEIFNMQKGCIVLANKCDLIVDKSVLGDKPAKGSKNRDDKYQTTRDYISHHFPFLWSCPVFFVSAINGEGLNEALAAIKPIFEARQKTVTAEKLTDFLKKKLKINPPKLLRDQKTPKVMGLKQTQTNPAQFELLVNHPAAISLQFRKYLENAIIKELGFWGTPISLKLKGKDKK